MRKIIICLLGSTGLLATPAMAADSQTVNATMQVQATVNAVCNVQATDIDFGTITTTASDIITTTPGTLAVTCSKTTPYTVTAASSAGQRAMKGTADQTATLNYGIFTDATAQDEFPTASDGTPLEKEGTGDSDVIDVYGKVLAGTSIPKPDIYTDQITFTITY